MTGYNSRQENKTASQKVESKLAEYSAKSLGSQQDLLDYLPK